MNRIRQGASPLVAVFALYGVLRLIVAGRQSLLEDHDSVGYLEQIRAFLSLDLSRIDSLGPDTTPVYPLFGALCSVPGLSVETGARLASMLFSVVLFVAIVSIGRRIAAPAEVTWGLAILSVSPVLVKLSTSVLSEPTYIGIVYAGLSIFWLQCAHPRWWKAAIVGAVFAAAFLTRTEGILYLVVPLFFQGAHYVLAGERTYDGKILLRWCGTYLIVFSVCIAPQIIYVSSQVGELAINGRQIWSLVLNAPDGKTYDEKIYGLDFSENETNLLYLQSHPEQRAQFTAQSQIGNVIRKVSQNFNELYQSSLGILIGPVVVILFGFGLLALYERRRIFELVVILSFLAINLIGPLAHNVVLRHIAIIAPMMFLVAGVGVVWLSGRVASFATIRNGARVVTAVVMFGAIGGWVYPMQRLFRPPEFNKDYDPGAMQVPIGMVRNVTRDELHRPPRIAGRKGYFAFLADGERVPLPYTDYAGLINYCRLNAVDFVLIEEALVQGFPFTAILSLEAETGSALRLLFQGPDRAGRELRLYRFEG